MTIKKYKNLFETQKLPKPKIRLAVLVWSTELHSTGTSFYIESGCSILCNSNMCQIVETMYLIGMVLPAASGTLYSLFAILFIIAQLVPPTKLSYDYF